MDASTRDRLIDMGAEIRRKRDELRDLERQFDALATGAAVPPPPPIPGGQVAAAIARSTGLVEAAASLPQRILARIREHPERTYTAEDLADMVEPAAMPTLRSALVRLYADGDGPLTRPERGTYKLRPTTMKPLFPANGTNQ